MANLKKDKPSRVFDPVGEHPVVNVANAILRNGSKSLDAFGKAVSSFDKKLHNGRGDTDITRKRCFFHQDGDVDYGLNVDLVFHFGDVVFGTPISFVSFQPIGYFGDIPNPDDTADSGRLRKVRTPDIFQKLLSIEAKDVTQSRGPEPSAVVLASVFRDITIGALYEIK